MEIYMYPSEWLRLPMTTRARLAEIFGIPRSKGTIVEDNEVVSDGYTIEDLQNITVQKMKVYLDSDLDEFVPLLDQVIARIDDETEPEVTDEPVDENQIMIDRWTVILAGMKSEAESKNMQYTLKAIINKLFPTNSIPNVQAKRGRPKKAN